MYKRSFPKISLFIADMGGGGAERVFANLAKAFSEQGYAVDLVVGSLRGATYLEEIPNQVKLVDLKMSRMALGGAKLIRYLRDEKPAVVLVTRIHSNCLAVLSKQISGLNIRIVVQAPNMLAPLLLSQRPFKRVFMAACVRYCYRRADHVVAVSQGVADELKQTFGIRKEKLSVIHSPIISKAMLKMAAESLDHPWFKEGEPPVILAVGRLTTQKNLETLIRAFARVRQKVKARLMILGEGEDRAALEALAAQLDLAGDFSLPGFQKNPFCFMARARLFVLSSIREGLPGVLIQALACGCPVLSTDCPSGPREILQDGRLGQLVPVGDDATMAEAILGSLREERLPGCHLDALQTFTVENAAREHLRVLLREQDLY